MKNLLRDDTYSETDFSSAIDIQRPLHSQRRWSRDDFFDTRRESPIFYDIDRPGTCTISNIENEKYHKFTQQITYAQRKYSRTNKLSEISSKLTKNTPP